MLRWPRVERELCSRTGHTADSKQKEFSWRTQFGRYFGNTPLIRLRRVSELTGCEILGKAEFMTPGLLLFVGSRQLAVEEVGGGAVGADPVAPAEQLVNFIGDD
jgi:hypothetical protein